MWQNPLCRGKKVRWTFNGYLTTTRFKHRMWRILWDELLHNQFGGIHARSFHRWLVWDADLLWASTDWWPALERGRVWGGKILRTTHKTFQKEYNKHRIITAFSCRGLFGWCSNVLSTAQWSWTCRLHSPIIPCFYQEPFDTSCIKKST